MSKRISITLEDEVVKKLRIIQAKKLTKSKKSISFSSVINDELRKAIR
jgi:predicted transcriptional regulator